MTACALLPAGSLLAGETTCIVAEDGQGWRCGTAEELADVRPGRAERRDGQRSLPPPLLIDPARLPRLEYDAATASGFDAGATDQAAAPPRPSTAEDVWLQNRPASPASTAANPASMQPQTPAGATAAATPPATVPPTTAAPTPASAARVQAPAAAARVAPLPAHPRAEVSSLDGSKAPASTEPSAKSTGAPGVADSPSPVSPASTAPVAAPPSPAEPAPVAPPVSRPPPATAAVPATATTRPAAAQPAESVAAPAATADPVATAAAPAPAAAPATQAPPPTPAQPQAPSPGSPVKLDLNPRSLTAWSDGEYTVQLVAANSPDGLPGFAAASGIAAQDLFVIRLRQPQADWWLLCTGRHPNLNQAQAAVARLPAAARTHGAWPRRVGPLKKDAQP